MFQTVFNAFSLQHLLVFIVVSILIFILYFLSKKQVIIKIDKPFRLFFAIFMVILELGFFVWSFKVNNGFNSDHLPFELCSITMWLTVYALITDNKKIIKVILPWSIIGVLLAFFSPSIDGTNYGFPHFRFLHFFGLHTSFLLANLYYLFSNKISKYTYKDLLDSFGILMIYAVIITIFNYVFKYNYLFTVRLPGPAAILHKIVKAPFHVIPYVFVIFALYNLVFVFIRKDKRDYA